MQLELFSGLECPETLMPSITSAAQFLSELNSYLGTVRGLAEGTRRKYGRFVQRFLDEWCGNRVTVRRIGKTCQPNTSARTCVANFEARSVDDRRAAALSCCQAFLVCQLHWRCMGASAHPTMITKAVNYSIYLRDVVLVILIVGSCGTGQLHQAQALGHVPHGKVTMSSTWLRRGFSAHRAIHKPSAPTNYTPRHLPNYFG
ncbi:hypothetical protein LMG24238_07692 [Paraburkholderia sediminicola]|uniref:Uncharacterized protein n=1 Tax=Paraburkholderia sediminicola TaxID=458836 RepID=A0A6J5CX91_9BURK|nr:hypothetical protein LMG24238_07692 [Paraburkholderia sediminicola]